MDTRLRDKAYSDQIMIKNDKNKSSALKYYQKERQKKINSFLILEKEFCNLWWLYYQFGRKCF